MTDKSITFGPNLKGILSGDGSKGSIVLIHGAGAGMTSSLLVKTANRLSGDGFAVLRFNFSYLGNKPAPSKDGKNEIPELESAIEYMRQYGEPILIGKSFGARISSYLVAKGTKARALVFYGMPLQGMNPSSKPRDWSHLARIAAPMLFITGDKDKLCPLPFLSEVLATIQAPHESHIVPGDHSFKPKSEDAAANICCTWVEKLVTQ